VSWDISEKSIEVFTVARKEPPRSLPTLRYAASTVFLYLKMDQPKFLRRFSIFTRFHRSYGQEFQ
jgi:hypothetical protein